MYLHYTYPVQLKYFFNQATFIRKAVTAAGERTLCTLGGFKYVDDFVLQIAQTL